MKQKLCAKGEEMTFPKFVDFLLKNGINSVYDKHFTEMWRRCDVCRNDFGVIGKLESYAADRKEIAARSGIRLKDRAWSVHVNKNVYGKTENMIKSLYSRLPRRKIEALYRLYKMDFDLFDYNPSKFTKMGYA